MHLLILDFLPLYPAKTSTPAFACRRDAVSLELNRLTTECDLARRSHRFHGPRTSSSSFTASRFTFAPRVFSCANSSIASRLRSSSECDDARLNKIKSNAAPCALTAACSRRSLGLNRAARVCALARRACARAVTRASDWRDGQSRRGCWFVFKFHTATKRPSQATHHHAREAAMRFERSIRKRLRVM